MSVGVGVGSATERKLLYGRPGVLPLHKRPQHLVSQTPEPLPVTLTPRPVTN